MMNPNTMQTYYFHTDDEGRHEVEADCLMEAKTLLREWIEENYDRERKTYWVRAWVTTSAGERHFMRVEIEAEEPECADEDGHDYKTGRVYGSGGGVCWSEKCRHCGLEKRVDTWATDPCDGSQGHRSVEYVDDAD